MELMEEDKVKGYCDSREEEEEEETATEEIITIREENSSRLLHQHQDGAGSNFIINNNNHHHHHQNDQNHHHHTTKQLDFMDLSLGTSKDNTIEANFQGSGVGGASSSGVYVHNQHHAISGGGSSSANNGNNNTLQQQQQPAEKEHMFDKVVTPSDVGKLNRLVIPKQHAEKYFPLDSSANEKGLLLNFEDRNGKLWRFRYSYWNSSQSYVMTKGWSRFVKEKKLDAGDIVSFQRGVGEMYRHRLYIDWRRRPDHHHHHHHGHGPDPSTTLFTPFYLPNQPHLMSIRWGATSTGRLYSLPSPTPPRYHEHLQQQHLHYNMYQHQQQQQQYPFHHHGGGGSGNGTHPHYNNYHEMSSTSTGSGSVFYLRSTPPSMPMVDHQTLNTRQQQQEGGNVSLSPMIIDSVPVAHNHHHNHQHYHGGKSDSSNTTSTAGKRLRLFGVNMECASSTTSDQDPKCFSLLSSSPSHVTMANSNSSLPSPLQLLREDTTTLSSSSPSTRFGDQRGEASMLFDLDPSLQYRQ